jgi:hypothetical protein
MEIIHYAASRASLATTCNKTVQAVLRDGNEMDIYSKDVNCTACLWVIEDMKKLGFFPR